MGGIVVPLSGVVGGNTQDDEVVRLACMLSRQMRIPLCFLHVIQVPRTLPVDAELPEQTQRGDEILLHAERAAQHHQVDVETALAQARDIGPAIVNEAVDRGADLVVMAIDPDRQSGTFHVGRTASYVLEHAPCPVIARRQALAETTAPHGR